jgi:hypothetical protein
MHVFLCTSICPAVSNVLKRLCYIVRLPVALCDSVLVPQTHR